MLNYIIRRVLYAIPILIGVSLLTFMLFYLTTSPENLARRNISSKNPTQAQIQQALNNVRDEAQRQKKFEGGCGGKK